MGTKELNIIILVMNLVLVMAVLFLAFGKEEAKEDLQSLLNAEPCSG